MPRSPYLLLKSLYRGVHRGVLEIAAGLGWNVALTSDFYSPLPVRRELERTRELWDRPSGLVGVDYDLDAIGGRLERLVERYADEYRELPSYEEHKELGYGPGFTLLDALVLYMQLRELKPRRYIEIGSGFSTYYAWLALERNRKEGSPCHLGCVDPFPTEELRQLTGLTVVASEVQALDSEFFDQLGSGDVLFIDSTHALKIGGDVAFLYLEVIPRLRPGVVIHSHDVHFPYNVPHPAEQYVFRAKWPRYWTEAMLLQAFLAFNREFEILISAPLLRHYDEERLARTIPDYRPVEVADHDTHFGSLWWRRVPRPEE